MVAIFRIFVFLLILIGSSSAHAETDDPISPAPTSTSIKVPEVVEVGVYLLSVYDLDHGASSYLMDMYLWFKWKGNIDPTQTLEFTNMIDKSGASIDNSDSVPDNLPDGSKYKIIKVEGRFTDPSSFYNYPFDTHDISIKLEDYVYGTNDLIYKIAPETSYDRKLSIPGWNIIELKTTVDSNSYDSTFGVDDPSLMYSKATFALVIERPTAIFYWKLMLPLAFIVLAGLTALVLPSGDFDARSALIVGALLTTVFLQRVTPTCSPMSVIWCSWTRYMF